MEAATGGISRNPIRRDAVVIGFVLTLAVLVIGGVLGYGNARRLASDSGRVAHTHEVILRLQIVLGAMKDAETGQRGYLLTEDPKYLKPYEDGVARVQGAFAEVKAFTSDNPAQQARLLALDKRIAAKLDELDRTVTLMKSGDRPGALEIVRTGTGMALMDDVRNDIAAMQQIEHDLLHQRADASAQSFRLTVLSIVVPAGLGAVLVGLVLYLVRRHGNQRERAARIIAEQAERLRTTLASIGDAVIATDTQGRIMMMNAVAESLTGWTHNSASGQALDAVFRIVNEETRSAVENPVTRSLREGVIVGLANHTVLIARDGTERPIDDSAAPIRCKEGEIVGCVLVFRDISERKQAERALAESAAFSRGVFESSPDCVKVLDAAGRLLRMNANGLCAMEIDDFAPLAGRPWCDLWPEEGRADVLAALDAARGGVSNGDNNGGGGGTGDAIGRFERFCPTARGTPRWWDVMVAPVRDADGQVIRFISVSRDVTERNRAEEELRASEQRLRFVMDSMPQKIFTATPAGDVDYFNPIWSQFSGLPFEHIRDWGWTEFIHPDDVQENIRVWQRSIEAGEPFHFEHRFRRHDGEYRWHVSRAVPMRDDGGRIVMWIGSNTDVDDIKRAEVALRDAKEAAEAANIAKDNFLATLSHELRTPLTPVLATLGAWEHAADFPAALREDVEMIRRNVDLEARLIDDLLDLTRIVKGKIALNFEVLNVHTLLGSVVRMYRSEVQGKRLDLSMRLEAEAHFVRADPGRLQQAFWNLLKNATKFTAEGGRIVVTTRNDARGRVQIVVQDNGIGISSEALARLFNPFEQGSDEVVKRYGGLGLGLAITRTLLEAQAGGIAAESEGPGRGATFIITLPAVEKPAETKPAETKSAGSAVGSFGVAPGQPAETAGEAAKCFRLLLVEDHADTARVLARLLRGNGHQVTVAGSVQQALGTAINEPFDLLVSDIGLPDGTGIDLIRQLRQQHGSGLRAVALTGFGMEDDVARCREAGFHDHLTKPVNLQKLEAAIQHVCAGVPGGGCIETSARDEGD